MGSNYFSTMEIDAIGEILNISLGASATAVSTMLNARVDITTPIVNVVSKEEFEMDKIEPAVGVEIVYVSGLEGNNVMLLKRHDVKVIVEMLMGMQMSDEEFELNEMNISAVCEVMNQMMGASSTALSEFLGKMVNISTPTSFEVKDEESFVDKYFDSDSPKVVVEFTLKIADKLESEFYNVMPIGLAKALVRGFLPDSAIIEVEEAKKAEETAAEPQAADTGADSGGVMSQEAIEAMLAASEAQEAPAADTGAGSGGVMSQEAIEAMLNASGAQEAPAADAGAGSGGVMSQEAIEAMLAASEAQEAPAADAGAGSGGVMSQEAIEAMLGASEAQAAPNMPTGAPSQAAPGMQMGAQPQMTPGMQPGAQPQMTPNMQMGAQMQPAMSPEVAMMQMQMMQQMMQQMQQMQQQLEERRKPAPEPKLINVQAAAHPNLNPDKDIVLEGEQEENMELIMGVPLEISVEIGRTKKFVKDILDFTKGSLVVLDKLAGEQVDLFVNGQCIAKGDVVVVEDNFGIRITEIMKINLATLE